MILPIEGLAEIHHNCQDGSLVSAILAGQYKIDELNYIVCYGVALEAPILAEVNLVLDVLQ